MSTDSTNSPAPNPAEMADALMAATTEYLCAVDRYDAKGEKLSAEVIKQLEPYCDPDAARAPIVRRFAEQLVSTIKEFGSSRATLSFHVAALKIEFSQRTILLAAEMIAALGRVVQERASRVVEEGAHGTPKLDTDELEALNDLGGKFAAEMRSALEAAVALIELREVVLQEYFDEVPRPQGKSVLGKVASAFAEEGAAQGAEMGLGALAKFLGTSAPIASVGVAVCQVSKDVRDKIRAMEAHYERNALDSMFEFAERISDLQDLFATVIELLQETQRFFAEASAISTSLE